MVKLMVTKEEGKLNLGIFLQFNAPESIAIKDNVTQNIIICVMRTLQNIHFFLMRMLRISFVRQLESKLNFIYRVRQMVI